MGRPANLKQVLSQDVTNSVAGQNGSSMKPFWSWSYIRSVKFGPKLGKELEIRVKFGLRLNPVQSHLRQYR